MLGPRNIHEKLFRTQKITTEKYFGPTKYLQGKILDPRNNEREKILDPQNTHENKFCTNEMHLRKNFGLPRRHGGTMARKTTKQKPQWHESHEIWHTRLN